MLGNINDLIQQIMQQQKMTPGGGVGISNPNPQLIPGGSGNAQPFPMGPFSMLAQQMAAGSRQPPVNAPGVPQQGPPQQSIPTPMNPGNPGIFGYPNIRFNPFQQFGGGIMSPQRRAY